MQKNALFFGKKLENPHLAFGGWELCLQNPELLLLSPVTVTFSKALVTTVKKEQSNLEIAIMYCFQLLLLVSYFKLGAWYPSYATGSDFSASIFTTYNISYLSEG